MRAELEELGRRVGAASVPLLRFMPHLGEDAWWGQIGAGNHPRAIVYVAQGDEAAALMAWLKTRTDTAEVVGHGEPLPLGGDD